MGNPASLSPLGAEVFTQPRANAYRISGQYDRAIADYRKAMTLKIDEPIKKQIEIALKELGATG
jgi:tetratricopeptide (TPR) repeat protein